MVIGKQNQAVSLKLFGHAERPMVSRGRRSLLSDPAEIDRLGLMSRHAYVLPAKAMMKFTAENVDSDIDLLRRVLWLVEQEDQLEFGVIANDEARLRDFANALLDLAIKFNPSSGSRRNTEYHNLVDNIKRLKKAGRLNEGLTEEFYSALLEPFEENETPLRNHKYAILLHARQVLIHFMREGKSTEQIYNFLTTIHKLYNHVAEHRASLTRRKANTGQPAGRQYQFRAA